MRRPYSPGTTRERARVYYASGAAACQEEMRLTTMGTTWLWPLLLLVLSCCAGHAAAWDNEELEVFDVVEEVNQNFYELLGVPQVRVAKVFLIRASRNLWYKGVAEGLVSMFKEALEVLRQDDINYDDWLLLFKAL